jgi:NADH-quinone oxidoreductase subunit N
MSGKAIITAMLPEHLLLAGIVLLIVLAIGGSRRGGLAVSVLIVAAAAVTAAILHVSGYAASPFAGHFSAGPIPFLAKAVVLALAVPVLLMARNDFADDSPFYPLLLSSLYGFCLLMSADSFLTLFLGLEIMSIPVYVMVLLAFQRPESVEAALKYLVLGGTATALFLMGVSLLYGGTGSLALSAFTGALGSNDPMATAAVVLVLIAFFLKAAIVPFHTWAPDAYEGASLSVTAFMATIIKAGVVLAALRLFGTAPVSPLTVDLLALLPLVSIVWGNLTAMRQTSFRRMIAYSSIAHAGYLFYAFLGAGPGRFQAVIFYLVAYAVLNLLAFASIPPGDDDTARDNLDAMKGLFHRNPYAAIMIGMAMLSLAGIPPFPGFVAKFLIFKNVMAAGYTLYAVLGLVGSYLGIYFYLRVIQYLFMSPGAAPAAPRGTGALALSAGAICLVATAIVTVFPGWVMGLL